jgi:hypothetical protein
MKQETIDKIKQFSVYPDSSQRIPSCDWKLMLLHNESLIVGGNVRYFQGVHIGSDVFRVKLLPINWDKEFGTIQLDPKTDWITEGTKLVLKKTKTCN